MADKTRLIAEARLLDLAARALQACGLAKQDARDAARILVIADLFGLSTHGVHRVISYGERLKVGGINARAAIRVEKKSPAIAMVDGDNGIGTLVGTRALEAAMAAARETGVGVAFARSSNRSSLRRRCGCSGLHVCSTDLHCHWSANDAACWTFRTSCC